MTKIKQIGKLYVVKSDYNIFYVCKIQFEDDEDNLLPVLFINPINENYYIPSNPPIEITSLSNHYTYLNQQTIPKKIENNLRKLINKELKTENISSWIKIIEIKSV